MIINLIPDDSVALAPSGFTSAIRSAADLLQQNFTDNITINIRYGWGTLNNLPNPSLSGSHEALGGPTHSAYVSYSNLKEWLSTKPALSQDQSAITSLPASPGAFPVNPQYGFVIATAEEKALGEFTGQSSALDGAIGVGTGMPSNAWFNAALHEITHAMGRVNGIGPGSGTITDPWVMDLYRYSASGEYQWSGGQPAYFSLNDGQTDLANFDPRNDTSDFAGDSLTSVDAFNASSPPTNILTPIDISVMDVLGFTPVGATVFAAPATSTAIAVLDTSTGKSAPATGLPYSGPVIGLQHQYVYAGQDNINVTVSDNNWFLHGGPGDDALTAHAGYNVLDGGTGSNFLSGGIDTDTFFVDDRAPPSDIWSTVTGFHAGDDVTVFGVTSLSANFQWLDNQGAAGFTGLTLHATTPNEPTASLTLPGYSVSDFSNNRLTVAFGSEPDGTSFMHISAHG